MTDGDRGLAERLRDELLDRAWVEREAFVYQIEPLAQSVARAKAMPPPQPGDGPVVLLDHYDNCASGGTMDTTVVLAEILRQGLDDVAAFAIYDPQAVEQAIAAGVGAQITLSIGGKIAMPAIAAPSPPLTVTGRVKTIADGRYKNRGPMARGVAMDMGPSVVLDTGAAEIVLISRHVEPSDLNCLLSLGVDPSQKRYLMLKSRIHWRAGLGPLARAVSTAPGSASARRITASFASATSGGRSIRSTCPTAEALARSSRTVAAAGRNRQPTVLLQPLPAFGGTEQGALAAAGGVVAGAILLRRLLALAAQLDQTGINRREIVGGTRSGHGFPPEFSGAGSPQARPACAKGRHMLAHRRLVKQAEIGANRQGSKIRCCVFAARPILGIAIRFKARTEVRAGQRVRKLSLPVRPPASAPLRRPPPPPGLAQRGELIGARTEG